MSLKTGTAIGNYEILSPIGAGGQGEVYRARDKTLERDVALKVLPDAFASHPGRLGRFEREAKVLAQLNHPHIATLHGLEEHEGCRFLVMELVGGQTLAERLAQGPVPLEEAIPLFIQIAEGLEAAHAKGIVHRDLKPDNIKLTPDGTAKILDFGLARAFSDEEPSPPQTESPTVTRHTEAGVILGTAPYVSPEQARGKRVDTRTDVWAFGCCVFQALTGKPPFLGATVSDTVAQILTSEPDWSRLPRSPRELRKLISRCLTKDASERLHHIADARIELRDISTADEERQEGKRSSKASMRELIAWLVAGVFLVTALFLSARGPEQARVVRFSFEPPGPVDDRPVLSPSGSHVVFGARSPTGSRQLWVRALDASVPALLHEWEAEQYQRPFWSPDGSAIAFFAEGKLNRIAVSGGAVEALAEAASGRGGTWNEQGDIVFQPGNRQGLYRMRETGGALTPVTQLSSDLGENSHRWPFFLPDGRHFLFTARAAEPEKTAIYVASLESGERQRLITAQSNAMYLPPGYILFARDGNLFAQAFDADRLQLVGQARPVVPGIFHGLPSVYAEFSVSADGRTLAYRGAALERQLAWFDRTGRRVEDVEALGFYSQVRISPDGARVAITQPDVRTGNRDIWLMDLRQGIPSRFTVGPANEWFPVFSPDGSRIAFGSDRNGQSSIYVKEITGDSEEPLWLEPFTWPYDWSRDGRLVFEQDRDLLILSLRGEIEATPLAKNEFDNREARFSPDGRWAAYVSDQSGRNELYVRSVDASRGRSVPPRRVSTTGGNHVRWSRDGGELFYLDPGGTLMRVSLELGAEVEASPPVPLFETCAKDIYSGDSGQPYDVSLDAERFLFICRPRDAERDRYHIVLNWHRELERLVSTE